MDKLHVKLLREKAKLPENQTTGSAGYDLAACIEKEVTIKPGQTHMVGSGIAIALPSGYAAFVYARSGLGIKHGIIPANCVGVIDSDYRGEIIVALKNTSAEPFTVTSGDRIAQLVITKCELPKLIQSEQLEETNRGAGGFGSTGSN